MQRFIFTLAAFFMAWLYLAPANAQDRIVLKGGETVKWQLDGGVKTYEFNDMIIKLTPILADSEVRFEISKADEDTISFSEKGIGGTITIARLINESFSWSDDQAGYEAAFSIYSGDCCSEAYITDYSNGAKIPKVGSFDGEFIGLRDIDGDGIVEYVDYDQRFKIFSRYSSPMPPLKIYSIENGKVRDATLDERFIPAHEARYKMQAIACQSAVIENPGPCTGLLGSAALLDVYDSTLHTLRFYLTEEIPFRPSSPYVICIDSKCQESKTIASLEPALLYALTKWNYLPSYFYDDDDLTLFMAAMVGRSFGVDGKACTERFEIDWNANNHKVYELSSEDKKCTFNKGFQIGNSVHAMRAYNSNSILVKAVCINDEETPWLENHIYDYNDGTLVHSSFKSSRFDNIVSQHLRACKD